MPFMSSPVSYPPSSSPACDAETRKRANLESRPAPAKRRLLQSHVSLPPKDVFQWSEGTVRKEFLVPREPPGELQESCANPFADDELGASDANGNTNANAMGYGALEALPTADSHLFGTQPASALDHRRPSIEVETSSGRKHVLRKKAAAAYVPYERLVAERSTTAPGRATRSYYGIDVHKLLEDAAKLPSRDSSSVCPTAPPPAPIEPDLRNPQSRRCSMMWTEKYRARKFTDLVGDERTHRNVLGWVKGWDPIVFPGSSRAKSRKPRDGDQPEERKHRKILLLTGPPGLGKTTLAHVCAKQAGYEVVEINASDKRSREVVKGKIRDCLGTENVRGVNAKIGNTTTRRPGRPVCVVVDEVDGVVGGGQGGGEGGFMKALIDLVLLDQKNTGTEASATNGRRKGRGDRFKIQRPLILICNDLYHPALRPLRSSNLAEIIHMRRPPFDKVVGRVRTVFEKEGLKADNDGVRRLCEATWGISGQKNGRGASNTCEGDLRGILVVAEGIASRLRATAEARGKPLRITKQWVEKHLVTDLSCGGNGDRGTGRGSVRDAVERVFLEGAGFPKNLTQLAPTEHWTEGAAKSAASATDAARGHAMALLRNVLHTCGEPERIATDLFAAYPARPFQDDTLLSKPNAAGDWLHFHDRLADRVFAGAEWELHPYLSQAPLAFHHLFAGPVKPAAWATDAPEAAADGEPAPFSGPRADFLAHEAQRANRASLQALQAALAPPLRRAFRSPEIIATELLPYATRLLSPEVRPVVVGGGGETRGIASVRRQSEKEMVRRGAEAMAAVGVTFERAKIEDLRGGYGGFVYRMEPPLDVLATFETADKGTAATAASRYAVRQVLDQELHKYRSTQAAAARQARSAAGGPTSQADAADKENAPVGPSADKIGGKAHDRAMGVKRDFFGRVIVNEESRSGGSGNASTVASSSKPGNKGRIWVTYHEGFSNAVRKPISLKELMSGF